MVKACIYNVNLTSYMSISGFFLRLVISDFVISKENSLPHFFFKKNFTINFY